MHNVVTLNDMWWHGDSNGRSGSFPASYARLAHGPAAQMVVYARFVVLNPFIESANVAHRSPTQARALFDYTAQDETQISFSADDIICEVRVEPDGWSWGSVNGRSGYFPTDFVDTRFARQ